MGCCCVDGCRNSNKNRNDLFFFKLPLDKERCRRWLERIRRNDLLKNINDLKPTSYIVCSLHFQDSDYRVSRKRTFLNKDAVPSQFLLTDSEYLDVSNSHTEKSVDADTQTDTKPEIMSNKENLITQDASNKQTLLNSLTDQNPQKRKLVDESITIKTKCRKLEHERDMIRKELDFKKPTFGKRLRRLIDRQNYLKEKFQENKYNGEYTMSALNLYYASPSAYRCMQTVINLPDRRTLNGINISISPKLDDRVLGALELKMKHLPDIARHCTITVGEMPLKRNLYYNIKTDEIIGFHNINGNVSPETASLAFIILLQGIQYKWVQPIAYALLAGDKYFEELDNWLSEVINKLIEVGIKVHAVISDQDSNFDKFAKDVKKITAEKPYFIYNGNKVYHMYDVLHLVKYVHANLPTSNYLCDGEKIAWKYIKQLYKDQKNRNLRLIPNITEAHIKPDNSQKNCLKYATEIFSRTVAAALYTYIDFDQMPEKARPTANFVEMMNNLIDVFNSSKLKSTNELRKPFTASNHQEKVLDEATEMFKTLKAVDRETGLDNESDMKLFVNFQISIQAVKMLYEDLKKEGFKYLLTRQLNRGVLDSFIDSIRQQLGPKSEPTPIQFRRVFQTFFKSNMLKKSPPSLNSDIDICSILLTAENALKSPLTMRNAPSHRSTVHLDGETDYRIDLPTENAVTYVSAYLWYKCMKKHKCSHCEEILKSVSDVDNTNLRTKYEGYNKTSAFYGDLKRPPEVFIAYVRKLEKQFRVLFRKSVQTNPGKILYNLLLRVPKNDLCICFPWEYLLKLFVRLRIYATLRYNNRQRKHNKS